MHLTSLRQTIKNLGIHAIARALRMHLTSLRQTIKYLGNHAIARAREVLGAKKKYCIRGSYRHRGSYLYFDDTVLKDDWQREVYLEAAELMARERLRRVYDVGCGSGYKLVKYLGQYDTIGFDVPETLPFLGRTYPDRKWEIATFSCRSHSPADLVICADVIEHVLDPVELMNYIVALSLRWIVLSTPDRNLMYERFSPDLLGPPRNPHHIREWSFEEFNEFVGRFMKIESHVISNRDQATQMIVATV